MNRTLRAIMLVAALGIFGLVGCEDEVQAPGQQDQAKGADQQKATPPPTQETALETAETEEYQRPEYPDSRRRNPFQPDPEVVQPQNTVGESDVRSRDPLEQFGLGQLELVAIISEVAVPKAMFIAPDGFGYVVKEGDRVGRNSGVVRDIRDNAVEIIEGGEDEESQTLQRVVKLRDAELSVGNDGLTEDERRRLEELLESEEGRQAVQRRLQERAQGANAAEGQERNQAQTPPRQLNEDPRFRGLTPPGGN